MTRRATSLQRPGYLWALPAVLLLAVATWRPEPAAGFSPAPQSSHLYIMFMPGLCGWTGSDPQCQGRVGAEVRAQATFHTLLAALSVSRVSYTPLYFSYNPAHPTWYTVSDTHQPVAISVSALHNQLRAVLDRDSHAQIDLVGHSLGGVVAASWAVTLGRRNIPHASRGLLRRVHSIVTFDSPLRGIHSFVASNVVTHIFGGPVWYSLQPNSQTIRQVLAFSNLWWKTAGHLHTVANVYDILVPPAESTLADNRTVRNSSCSIDFLWIRLCHGAVLADASLSSWVACHWISSASCAPPPPHATATPARSPTPPPSPTPTSARTATPVPSATPTARAAATPSSTPATPLAPTETPTITPSPSVTPTP